MHVILAILIGIFSLVGGFGPRWDGELPNAGGGIEAQSDQGWTSAAFLWQCTDPDKCPDDIACPQCPEK